MATVTEETINGVAYVVTTHDSGRITRELKMSEAQKAAIAVARTVTLKQFLMQRFTSQELTAINALRRTDDLADALVNILLASQKQEVELDDPDLSTALDYFVAQSVLTAERKAAILAREPAAARKSQR